VPRCPANLYGIRQFSLFPPSGRPASCRWRNCTQRRGGNPATPGAEPSPLDWGQLRCNMKRGRDRPWPLADPNSAAPSSYRAPTPGELDGRYAVFGRVVNGPGGGGTRFRQGDKLSRHRAGRAGELVEGSPERASLRPHPLLERADLQEGRVSRLRPVKGHLCRAHDLENSVTFENLLQGQPTCWIPPPPQGSGRD